MRRAILATSAIALLPTIGTSQDQLAHHHHETPVASPNDPPLRITINPEERLSVLLVGPLPPPAPCGMPVDLPIRIVNQSFATAVLEAKFVGDPPVGVSMLFHPDPLTGAPEELRHLQITLTKSGPTDLTISFKPQNELPDLGGRDRVHFLISCH